jgi:hypothetical protein
MGFHQISCASETPRRQTWVLDPENRGELPGYGFRGIMLVEFPSRRESQQILSRNGSERDGLSSKTSIPVWVICNHGYVFACC